MQLNYRRILAFYFCVKMHLCLRGIKISIAFFFVSSAQFFGLGKRDAFMYTQSGDAFTKISRVQ